MARFRPQTTGVANTVFISTTGYGPQAPYILIAVDPPDTLDAARPSASMLIEDGTLAGPTLAPHIAAQARSFVERNRAALLDYWHCQIDTAELAMAMRSE